MRHWIDLLLLVYPPVFRTRFGTAMRQAFLDGVSERLARSRFDAAGFVARASLDAIVSGLAERVFERRRAVHASGLEPQGPGRGARVFSSLAQDTRRSIRLMQR